MWHAGVLQRVEDILRLINDNPTSENIVINSFNKENFRGVRIEDLLRVAKTASWIDKSEGELLECSKSGRILLSTPGSETRMRIKVETLLNKLNPPWAATSVQGRLALVKYAPPEFEQCLREAGLMSNFDKGTIEWWDRLASKYRQDKSQANLDIGRQGERLSIHYEYYRTGFMPKWTAIEYSGAGYDLVSRISRDDPTHIVIEVKTSTKPWEYAEFFITRFEWDTLCIEEKASIHMWSVKTSPPLVAVATVDEVAQHVANDSGKGQWQTLKCPFSEFEPVAFDGELGTNDPNEQAQSKQ